VRSVFEHRLLDQPYLGLRWCRQRLLPPSLLIILLAATALEAVVKACAIPASTSNLLLQPRATPSSVEGGGGLPSLCSLPFTPLSCESAWSAGVPTAEFDFVGGAVRACIPKWKSASPGTSQINFPSPLEEASGRPMASHMSFSLPPN
jgi:hypothetical protein